MCVILLASLAVVTAGPGDQVTVSPLSQDILIGGQGTYAVTVKTDVPGTHYLWFDTQITDSNKEIVARLYGQGGDTAIPGDPWNISKGFTWTATGAGPFGTYKDFSFTFVVYLENSGGTLAHSTSYNMQINDDISGATQATATPTVRTIPEFSLVIGGPLLAIAVGMLTYAFVRRRKKS